MSGDLLFRRVLPGARVGWLALIREGWKVEHVDRRYGTVLMSRNAPPEGPEKAVRRPQEARSTR